MTKDTFLINYNEEEIQNHLKVALDQLIKPLNQRENNGLIRKLTLATTLISSKEDNYIDFSSNDYLSLSEKGSPLQSEIKKQFNNSDNNITSGSTGSRLLDGNYKEIEQLEELASRFHSSSSALLFNSGFDANVSLFSTIATKESTIIYDQLIHASIHDGLKLSKCQHKLAFKHNDLSHLEVILTKTRKLHNNNIYIAVESVYSMDGDKADIKKLVSLCLKYKAQLIIDEAHATGIYGKNGEGLTNEALNNDYNLINNLILARIITYGKSFCNHGAVILCNSILKQYLINYARPLIYSTFLPPITCLTIQCAYKVIMDQQIGGKLRQNLLAIINEFKQLSYELLPHHLLTPSTTQIQAVLAPGNFFALKLTHHLQSKGYLVRAIRYPTVPKGQERIRICLRASHNKEQLRSFLNEVLTFIQLKRPTLLSSINDGHSKDPSSKL
ncbi:PLP-dependent transferase [Neoconidiobolus thromboides FSU 785]|nr:PLP-dependent transferase [Neoconidiobolus thromboides FSU 785]